MNERRGFIKSLLAEKLGISLGSFVESAVADLVETLSKEIDPDAPETIEALIDACCVGETMFMRHPEHFSTLIEQAPRSKASLKVWSAGCCTGEEAYSLAVTLSKLTRDFKVIGTDVNLRFLKKARQARYSPWSLRSVDLKACDSWLDVDPSGVRVKNWLKQYVSFKRVNLLNIDEMGRFDVIFCRNVLMYFYPDLAQNVINSFASHLEPGGLLFLGYCDPTPEDGSLWQRFEHDNVIYYRRRGPPEMSLAPPKRPVQQSLPPEPKRLSKPVRAAKVSKPQEMKEDLEKAQLERFLADIYRYANAGKLDVALSLFEIAVAQCPLASELYVIAALIHGEQSEFQKAKVLARKACFLSPESSYARYVLGYCLLEAGKRAEATQQFLLSQQYLGEIKAGEVVPLSQSLNVAQLQRLLDDCLGGAHGAN